MNKTGNDSTTELRFVKISLVLKYILFYMLSVLKSIMLGACG